MTGWCNFNWINIYFRESIHPYFGFVLNYKLFSKLCRIWNAKNPRRDTRFYSSNAVFQTISLVEISQSRRFEENSRFALMNLCWFGIVGLRSNLLSFLVVLGVFGGSFSCCLTILNWGLCRVWNFKRFDFWNNGLGEV